MNLNIPISPEMERQLLSKAAQLNKDVSSIVLDAVQRAVTQVEQDDTAGEVTYDQWKTEFDAWISRQKSRNPSFDDNRDSIYE